MNDADTARLRDILAAIDAVKLYCTGVSEARFVTDIVLQDAVVRRIMIIGEAASKLTAEARLALSAIPWSEIISMRHVLVHDYSDLNEETVWKTVRHELPELKKLLLKSFDFGKGELR